MMTESQRALRQHQTDEFLNRRASVIREYSDEALHALVAIRSASMAFDDADTDETRRAAAVSHDLMLAWYVAARQDRFTATATLDHLLDIAAPVLPDLAPTWGGVGRECAEWVEWATPAQVMQMLAACLTRVGDKAPVNPRKAALVALWNSLGPEDRAAFVRHIGPDKSGK